MDNDVPIEVVIAAMKFISALKPDNGNEAAPMWHGWAIRDAFIEGFRRGRGEVDAAVSAGTVQARGRDHGGG